MIGSGVSSRRMLQVDARDYGVLADGTTDNAAALSAAVVAAAGKTLALPTGTIGIGSKVTISTDDVRIVLQPGTVIKRLSSFSSSTNGDLMLVSGDQVRIEGGVFDGGFAAGSFESLSGVTNTTIITVYGNAERFHLLGATLRAPTEYITMSLGACSDARVEDCEFIGNSEATSGATRHNIYGFWSGSSSALDWALVRCTFRYHNWNGAYLGGRGSVIDCVFDDNHWSVDAPTGGGAQVGWAESNTSGSLLIKGVRIRPSTNGLQCNGIEVFNAAASIVITDFDIRGQSNAGIAVGVDASNVVISNGTLVNNGTNGSENGLSLETMTGGCIVSGVRAYDDQGSPTQEYGIETNASDHFTVMGCDLRGNKLGALNVNDSPTDYRVVGNLPDTVTDV